MIFSPNDVVKLANTCIVAERTVGRGTDIEGYPLPVGPPSPDSWPTTAGRTGKTTPRGGAAAAPTYAYLDWLAMSWKGSKNSQVQHQPLSHTRVGLSGGTLTVSLYTSNEVLLALSQS